MSWSGSCGMLMGLVETLESGVDAASSPTISHSAWGTQTAYSATTTPAISKGAYFTQALTAGAATIDLTALTGTAGAAVSLSGLKVQLFWFINGTVTSNAIAAGSNSSVVITPGSSNPYDIFGTASDRITVAAGAGIFLPMNESLEDVDSTHCEIDLAGTGTDEFLVGIVAG